MIPRVDDSKQYFLNKITIVYGVACTGKSTTIRHIVKSLAAVKIICCPTNALTQEYDGIAPADNIYNYPTAELMQTIISKQSGTGLNLLLVIDDCASEIQNWLNLPETKYILEHQSELKITLIMSIHSSNMILPKVRNSADISIFTTEKNTLDNFNRVSTGVSPAERKQITNIASELFSDKYNKLVVFGPSIDTDCKYQYIGDLESHLQV